LSRRKREVGGSFKHLEGGCLNLGTRGRGKEVKSELSEKVRNPSSPRLAGSQRKNIEHDDKGAAQVRGGAYGRKVEGGSKEGEGSLLRQTSVTKGK